MFWFVCITTAITAMASLPLYRLLGRNVTSYLPQQYDWFHVLKKSIWSPYYCSITLNSNIQYMSTDSSNKAARPKEKFRIYTRTGDNGTSGLFTGERRYKDDIRFEALGTTDELSSAIGLAREFVNDKIIRNELEQIQCILQDLQATVATPKSSANEFQQMKTKWNVNHLVELEDWIAVHSDKLPPLKNFILPSGGQAGSALHLARAICRRAERRLIPLLDEGLELPVLQYLNRLSSYLFTVARVCAKQDGHQEVIYWQRPNYNEE